MRRMMRSILVALLVAMLTFSPATACHYCGGYGGGYYTSGGYYGGWSDGGCDGCEIRLLRVPLRLLLWRRSRRQRRLRRLWREGGDCDGCDGCAGCETDGVTVEQGEAAHGEPEPPLRQPEEHSLDREPHAVGGRPCLPPHRSRRPRPKCTRCRRSSRQPKCRHHFPKRRTATNANPGRRADDSSRCNAGRFVQHAFD